MTSADTRSKIETLIKDLLSVTQIRSIYGKEHKLTLESIDKLYAQVEDALSGRNEITIGIIGNEVVFEKKPFYELSRNVEGFVEYLKEMKIEKIVFARGVSKKEVADLVDILTINPKTVKGPDDLEKMLKTSSITNVAFGKIALGGETLEGDDLPGAAKVEVQEGIDFFNKTLDDVNNNRPIDASAARFFVGRIVNNLLKNKNSLLMLTGIKGHDEYTFVHSINVAIFSIVQAESLGMDESCLADIGIAGLLHDAGKLAISGDILRKKEKLDKDEIQEVQVHPADGAKILLLSPGITPLAALASFEHHIRYDMSGYPKRLYGGKMNLLSMLIAIADVYDALRSKRAYRAYMSPEEVYEEMSRLRGQYFDPELLDNFFRIMGIYPPGTLVELENKAIGLVIKESSVDIRRPQVEILYDNKGEKEANPYIINLMEKESGSDGYKWTIVRSIALSDKYEIPDKYL